MQPFSVRRLFTDPPIAGTPPLQVRVAMGGRHLAFLRAEETNRERLSLWRYSLRTRELAPLLRAPAQDGGTPSAAERAERERLRRFAGGVTAWHWLADGERALATVDGAAWLCDGRGGARLLMESRHRHTGLAVSPNGRFVSFVRDGDLFLCDIETGAVRQLTTDASDVVTNGAAEFIAQEEMHRFDGHWWSHDGRRLAFTRVNVADIPETRRFELHEDRTEAVVQRYPHAGGPNAAVELALLEIDAEGRPGTPQWLGWAEADDAYLARVAFAPSGRLVVQAQSRDQRRLTVKCLNPTDGRWTTLFKETGETWINLHDNLTFLGEGDAFAWTSERNGQAALYRFDDALRPWPTGLDGVRRVICANAETAVVAGWRGDPTTQHIHRIPWRGGAAEPLTEGDGWHEATADPHGVVCAITATAPEHPARLEAIHLASGERHRVCGGPMAADHPYHPFLPRHVPATFGTLLAEDAQTLHYRLTPPAGHEDGARHPVVVHVYGGPGVQRVRREWGPLVTQLFAQRGYGVLELDNRGGAGRDKRFEDAIHGQLGAVEVRDQLAGVSFLRGLEWVDASRIAIMGHSYGGYLALLCMAKAPEAFAVGVSIAPVTDWTLYDTHYTERYLGMPDANPEGYRLSAVSPWLDGLRGPLLLMHGMADDNVLFAHSTRLMHALQERGVPFELMTYPGAKHALQERPVAIHRYRTILDFLRRRL